MFDFSYMFGGLRICDVRTIDEFIQTANINEIRKCFPTFISKYTFDYAKHKRIQFEQRTGSKTDEVLQNYVYECRNRYYYNLELQKIRDEGEFISQADRLCDLHSEECLRCLLIRQGSYSFPKLSMRVCVIDRQPEAKVVSLRRTLANKRKNGPDCQQALALSVTMGAFDNRQATPNNLSFEEKTTMKFSEKRSVHSHLTLHNCLAANFNLQPGYEVNFLGESACNTIASHTLIYAPPGFGKSQLQYRLFKRGIFIYDAADTPQLTTNDVEFMLRKSSVLTDSLKIVQEITSHKVLIFSTTTGEKLVENTGQWIDEDVANRCCERMKEIATKHEQATLCLSDDHKLVDWFDC